MQSPEAARGAPPRVLIALLSACSIAGPIGTSFFLPALPAIGAGLGEPVAAVQATISAYLVAFACGILLAGPLADRFGRRPVIVGGIALFMIGALHAAAAPTLPWLVFARVVQGLGAAAGITVARASAADLYDGPELARRLATLTMAMVLGTAFAPWIGGLVVAVSSWRIANLALGLFGAAVLAACLAWLPETRPGRIESGHTRALLREARAVLGRAMFFRCVLEAGVIYAVFLVFISIAPYLMTDLFGRPASEFGAWYLVVAGGYFIGNWWVSRHAHRRDSGSVVRTGLLLQVAGATGGLVIALAGWRDPLALFLPMFPLSIGQGLALPIITARAVQLAPGFAGVASSLVGFSQQAIAALGVQLMGWAPTSSPVPVYVFCALASLLALFGGALHAAPRERGAAARP